MKPKQNGWKLVGHFGVDSGLCWIGDPGYILHTDESKESIGKDWPDFCNKLERDVTKFPFNMGHEGLGVCVSTGWGDGYYPVYARFEGGRIMQLYIDFDGE